MKRFTETTINRKAWFRKLSPEMKCVWRFLCDECDSIGLWSIDMDSLEFHIGAKFNLSEIIKAFNSDKERLRLFDDKILLLGFIEFQYGKLSPSCKPHVSVIQKLKSANLWIPYTKGLETLEEKEEDKDKEQEKEKEKERGGVGEIQKSNPPKRLSASEKQDLHFNPVKDRIINILSELKIFSPKANRHMAEIVEMYGTIENFDLWLTNTKSHKRFKELLQKATSNEHPEARAQFANYFISALLGEAGLRTPSQEKSRSPNASV